MWHMPRLDGEARRKVTCTRKCKLGMDQLTWTSYTYAFMPVASERKGPIDHLCIAMFVIETDSEEVVFKVKMRV